MPAALRSSCSKLSYPGWCSCWSFSSLMLGLQNLFRVDVVGGQERQRTQVVTEVGDPQSAHCEGNHQVRPGHAEGCGEVGLDDPEKVHVAHEQQPPRQVDELCYVALERPGEQNDERHCEVEDDQERADESPSAIEPAHIPGDFFRQV